MAGKPDKPSTFSQLVCSDSLVRNAYDSYAPAKLWWRLILMLHGKPNGKPNGKPTSSALATEQEDLVIAAGFRFYAWLYRFLAVVFLLLGPLLMVAEIDADNSVYWALFSVFAGASLWFISGLGFAGARDYARDPACGAVVLIAFMTMIVAFLSAFVAAVSVAAAQLNWLATAPNLAATGLLFVVGIGSYFLEIIYLASRETRRI